MAANFFLELLKDVMSSALQEELRPQSELPKEAEPEIPHKFLSLKDDVAKIRFCLDKKKIPKHSEVFKPKNNSKSAQARAKGNELYKNGDFVEAFQMVNLSQLICLPSIFSKRKMGYANRSAVFFKCGFYKFCLDNIQLAYDNNYPEELREKLETRRLDCIKMLEKGVDSEEKYEKERIPLKLSHPADKNIPMMIKGLELAQNEQYGRFVRTNRDLNPGDILLIENAFTSTPMPEKQFHLCDNCLDDKSLNLLPCEKCTGVMFCSKKCQLEAEKRFHKYECPIIDALSPLTYSASAKPATVATRAALKSLTMFENFEDLQKLVAEIGNKNEVFNVDYKNLSEEQYFRALFSIPTNISRNSRVSFDIANCCAEIWILLSHFTDLPKILDSREKQDFFLKLLYRLFYVTPTILGQENLYGNGIFGLSEMINHSCAPNIYRIFNQGTSAVVAIQSIKAGEQIFDCYHSSLNHLFEHLEVRQETLRTVHFFECKCEACTKNYPMQLDLMGRGDMRFYRKQTQDYEECAENDEIDVKNAKMKLVEYKRLLKKYEKNRPSSDLMLCQAFVTHVTARLVFGRDICQKLKAV
ncbi:SET and MYND domain-containing protein 4-like [Culicoides brevitarsis]|uniref:SET and MYND domain-containing protein 4-like n=1 Tax=Culicoides brevitarsis TaxID=469753 RepID=UPI00307BDE20